MYQQTLLFRLNTLIGSVFSPSSGLSSALISLRGELAALAAVSLSVQARALPLLAALAGREARSALYRIVREHAILSEVVLYS